MIRQLLAATVLAFFVGGCDSYPSGSAAHYPTVVLREEQGFAVISEQRTYYRETGSVVEYGAFWFKLNGSMIKDVEVSNALFPESSECRSPFYTINDIRLLPNNSVIALMSTTNPNCNTGRIYLAIVSPDKNRLKVQRLPIMISGEERGIDSLLFHRSMPDGYGYGYEGHEDRLAVQRSTASQTVGIVTAWEDHAPSHMVMVNLDTLRQIDMGEGKIDRFVEKDAIALMRRQIGRDVSRSVQFKAVRATDGETIDQALYPDNCFRPVGKLAKDKAMSSFGMLAMDEQINSELAKKASGEAMRKDDSKRNEVQVPASMDVFLSGRDIDFDSDNLSGISLKASNYAIEDMLLGKESRLEWDETRTRIKVTISPEVRQIKACENQGKSGKSAES